ncbi:hypothetical protein PG984_000236 [Apiospora sp. TS-2023a]
MCFVFGREGNESINQLAKIVTATVECPSWLPADPRFCPPLGHDEVVAEDAVGDRNVGTILLGHLESAKTHMDQPASSRQHPQSTAREGPGEYVAGQRAYEASSGLARQFSDDSIADNAAAIGLEAVAAVAMRNPAPPRAPEAAAAELTAA